MSDIAIKVDNVSKMYRIFDKPEDRLKDGILWRWGKRYGREFWALKDISFEVKKGESVGIIGRNGSGKSTLLQIIAGTLQPSCGNVQVNGRVAALLELGSGFNPDYTGRENVYMNASILGLTKEETDAKFDAIASFADIGEFLEQPVKTYSSGMMMRLAFAVQTAVDPDILIVDEALGVGDAAFQAKCMSRMHRIMNAGCSILFVSHDTTAVKRFCSMCVYLQSGMVKSLGVAERIADEYMYDMRLLMTAERMEIAKDLKPTLTHIAPEVTAAHESCTFIRDTTFDDRVRIFRQGTGSVRVCGVELLDDKGSPVLTAHYNQTVRLRVHIEFHSQCLTGLGYHIRDSKHLEIIGSNIIRESQALISGKPGNKYTIEFKTRLPLVEGNYNISIVVALPLNRTSSLYYDFVENAYLFAIEEDTMSPTRLYDRVYIENTCIIFSHNTEAESTDIPPLEPPSVETSHTQQEVKRFLEIGHGETRLAGFETLNIVPTPITDHVLDATQPLPFSDNTFELIYASHVLEHLPWYQTASILKEWLRVIRPGGKLEIWVPDGLKICEAYVDAETTSSKSYEQDGWYKFNPNKDPTVWANGRIFSYGDGQGTRGHHNWHLALFSERRLQAIMQELGMIRIEIMKKSDIKGYDHGWINLGIRGEKPSV